MTEFFEYTSEQEDKLDDMVDKGFTYDDARRQLGIKAIDIVEQPTPQTPSYHKPSRPRVAMGPQYGDNAGVETPDGRPHYDHPYEPLSDEQIAINKRGSEKVQEALRRAREQRKQG